MERKNRELEQRNAELVESRHQLMQSQHRAAVLFSAFSEALPGRVLDGRYRLDERIGSGGFGVVFRATHLGLGRQVAVKVFQPSPSNATAQGLERFRREGMSACRVAHPNAVAVVDSGVTEGGLPYLVMELLSGQSLAQLLRAVPRLEPARAAAIVEPVCDVLHAAHAAGIVHRDIKPENIVLHRDGGTEVVKVVDFGLAKLVSEDAVEDAATGSLGAFVGSPDYVAPERLRHGQLTGRSDVYSVGVMLYRMLAGRLPFMSAAGDPFTVAMMHLTDAPAPLDEVSPEVPPAVAAVVMSALAKDADLRPDPRELSRRLAAALAGSPPAGV
jgi:serine/threonine protein kinase